MKVLLLNLFIVFNLFGQQLDPCDINSDGIVNVLDYQSAVNMALGKKPCTADINGKDVCNVITLQRIIGAALGKGCVMSNGSHYVQLTWTASITSGVNYNVYKSTVSGGPYTKINTTPVSVLRYLDNISLQSNVTYYYVVTAFNEEGESVYSNEAQALIPQ